MSKAVEVLLPLMGEGVNEATLTRWLKKTGDVVKKGEPLLEVSTDKVDTEIPSPHDGPLRQQMFKEGDVVAVNAVLAVVGEGEMPTASGRQAAARSPQPAGGRQAAVASRPSTVGIHPPGSGARRASPIVRKMAAEHGVNLDTVPGSGLHGRITKVDILHALANPQKPSASAHPGHTADVRLKTTKDASGKEFLDGVAVKREKLSRMRKLIADHMVESVRVSPHVTTVFEVDMHRVAELREKHRAVFEKREGFKLTYTPFLIHAAVQAIKAHPIVNVSLDGDEILYKEDINVGVAVALENGLIVPVVKNAQLLSLTETARRMNDLVVRARAKKLQPDEVQGGTFSITNPGGFGSITSNPIINQPQVAILGIGAIVKRPVVLADDQIKVRPLMWISLTFDHRVIDGEGGAKYLATLKQILETYDVTPT